MRKIEIMKSLGYLIEAILQIGLNGYLISMIFIIATIGLAKIILVTCTKQKFKYSNLLIFCIIGLIISVIFKIFKLNLSKKYLEMIICLITNILLFIIFKFRRRLFNKQQ